MINKIVLSFYYRIHWPILKINLFFKALVFIILKSRNGVCYKVDIYLAKIRKNFSAVQYSDKE